MQRLRTVYTPKQIKTAQFSRIKTQTPTKLTEYCINKIKTTNEFGFMPKKLRIEVNGKNLSPYFTKKRENHSYSAVRSPRAAVSESKIDVNSFIYRKYITQKTHEQEEPIWHIENIMKLRKILKKKPEHGKTFCEHFNGSSYHFRDQNKKCQCMPQKGQQMIKITNPDIFARTLTKRITHKRQNLKTNSSLYRNIKTHKPIKIQQNKSSDGSDLNNIGIAPWEVD